MIFTSSEHHLLSFSSLNEFQEAFDYFFHEDLSPNLIAKPDLICQINPQLENGMLAVAFVQRIDIIESLPQLAILLSNIDPSLEGLLQLTESHLISRICCLLLLRPVHIFDHLKGQFQKPFAVLLKINAFLLITSALIEQALYETALKYSLFDVPGSSGLQLSDL